MEFKKDDSWRIQESSFNCLVFFQLSLTKGTDYSLTKYINFSLKFQHSLQKKHVKQSLYNLILVSHILGDTPLTV